MVPSFSVIIPAFNAEATVTRAVASVLAQTRAAHEIIVVDDGSTDATATVLRRFGRRIRYLPLDRHAGASVARNRGIREASGDWIAFLDADDEWLPDKLALQARLIAHNPCLTWCIANYLRCCRSGDEIRIAGPPSSRLCLPGNPGTPAHGYLLRNYFEAARRGRCVAHTNLVVVRRSALATIGLFDPELSRHQDWDLWWRIALRHPVVGYIHVPLARRMVRGAAPDAMIRRVRAKRGHCLRKLYAKALVEAAAVTSAGSREDRLLLAAFRRFAARSLAQSVLMMVFLGYTGKARCTLTEFAELFPPSWRLALEAVSRAPLMPSLVRGGYHAAQRAGLMSRRETYWDYLRIARNDERRDGRW